MRIVALFVFALAAGVPAAQDDVRLDVSGPSTLTLGEPLVLNVTATRVTPGSWPTIYVDDLASQSVVVRRDSVGGPVVELAVPVIVCGVRVSGVLGKATVLPPGTAEHHRVVIHDERLMRPGRYVLDVRVEEDLVNYRTVHHAVDVVLPAELAEREAAERVAAAIREAHRSQFHPYGRHSDVIYAEALRETEGTRAADIALYLLAWESASLWYNWRSGSSHTQAHQDSVVAVNAERTRRLVPDFLERRPASPLAPALVRIAETARAEPGARPPWVDGVCEGRKFRVAPGRWAGRPLHVVAVGTGERVEVVTDSDDPLFAAAEVAFAATPEAVHLVADGRVVAVGLPDSSTCPTAPPSLVPPPRDE